MEGGKGQALESRRRKATDPPTHFTDGECGDLVLGGMC